MDIFICQHNNDMIKQFKIKQIYEAASAGILPEMLATLPQNTTNFGSY